jgi:hypothetical protein
MCDCTITVTESHLEQGRVKRYREIVILTGSYFITMPIAKTPEKEAKEWLSASSERKEMKTEAEKLAKDDVVGRVKKRKQL